MSMDCKTILNAQNEISSKRRQVWDCELEIVMLFDSVCKKYNLKYFLEAGTLLGAVRHHGFIPWDDDIDISMPRNDYDKLLEIGPKEFKNPYFFQYISTEPKYPGLHVKIRDSRTTAIIKSWLFTNVNQGIFIDVFPLEGVPNNKKVQQDLQNKATVMGRAIKSYYNFDKILSLNPKIILMLLKRRRLAKSLIRSSDEYIYKYEQYQKMFKDIDYESCDKVGLLSFGYGSGQLFLYDKKDYSEQLYVDFDKIKLPIPIGYDHVLKTYFGQDYMVPKLLPSDHGDVYFDTERSYTYYLPILRKEYSFIRRLFRALKSCFTHDDLTKLEKELYKM